jgi:hypothetical protein
VGIFGFVTKGLLVVRLLVHGIGTLLLPSRQPRFTVSVTVHFTKLKGLHRTQRDFLQLRDNFQLHTAMFDELTDCGKQACQHPDATLPHQKSPSLILHSNRIITKTQKLYPKLEKHSFPFAQPTKLNSYLDNFPLTQLKKVRTSPQGQAYIRAAI